MVISDYNLPGKSGLEFLEWLNAQEIDIPFIMMTGMGDQKTAVKAMQGGAYNYIVKDDVYLSVLPHVVDETFIQYLSDREKEILSCLVKGMSYKLIADACFISIDTVRGHIRNIYEKLHVHSKGEAIATATKGKIV